ncbi:hypothetical protein BK809_0005882 [Diplodia seriata]|uniref:Uncharacterized protein n=1 Tax=Diplodia seriata TaxID=420778 RepID=A0A1S8BNS5_9PEZI|nr:hypothetical protein BK809_0005882 [Diplodia seriata]
MAISTIPLPIRPPTSSSTSSSSSLLTPTPTTPIRHHPHHPHHHYHHQPTYIRSGIGGAGNWHKASSIPPPPPPQSPATTHHHRPHVGGGGGPLTHDNNSAPLLLQTPSYPPLPRATSSSTHFKSGIGGAGNTHPLTARSVLGFDEEVARCRAVERRLPVAYHVGIGGAGNFRARSDGGGSRKRLRPQTSAGALGMKRSEGDLRIEAGAQGGAVPRAMVERGGGAVKRVSWGEHSVDEFEVDGYEGDGEMEAERECVYYSNEPLPYGALDVLRRRLERAFASRSGGVGDGREVLASPKDKRRGAVLVGSEGERRGLRSHRSMWRF